MLVRTMKAQAQKKKNTRYATEWRRRWRTLGRCVRAIGANQRRCVLGRADRARQRRRRCGRRRERRVGQAQRTRATAHGARHIDRVDDWPRAAAIHTATIDLIAVADLGLAFALSLRCAFRLLLLHFNLAQNALEALVRNVMLDPWLVDLRVELGTKLHVFARAHTRWTTAAEVRAVLWLLFRVRHGAAPPARIAIAIPSQFLRSRGFAPFAARHISARHVESSARILSV